MSKGEGKESQKIKSKTGRVGKWGRRIERVKSRGKKRNCNMEKRERNTSGREGGFKK